MKYPFRDDYAVQVLEEEREAEIPEMAHFFRGIYDITLWRIISTIRFVPAFFRHPENWPLTWIENSDIVHSEEEARLVMAGLAYMAITPDDKQAGEKEFFTYPPSPLGISIPGPDKGVLFFVTSEQYEQFNQELCYMAKQTVFANQYLRLSTVKHMSVIKYILGDIVPFHKQWQKEWREKSRQTPLNGRMSAVPVAANEDERELVAA